MKYGTLHITLPEGKSHDYSIDQPNFSIGRAQGNDLIVEDISVSRRHARFTIESGRLMIEDLGSANGTFISHQRLTPNTLSLVPDDQVVCLGDVEIRYVPPPPLDAPQVFTPSLDQSVPPAPSGPPLGVSLVGPSQPVAPGNVVTANLTVQNRGAIVDELMIKASGVPIEWVRLSKDRVPLLPNAQETITITFAPPRRSEAAAADYSFVVSVISREHHTGINADGTLKVLPFQSFTLRLEPQRSQRDFEVIVGNQGNAPTAYRFSGVDDEHGLTYQFGQEAVTLQPGQSGAIPLSIEPKIKPRIGTRETRSFSIIAAPVDPAASEVKSSGQLIIRPPIPVWLIVLVSTLLVALCGGGAWAYSQVCGSLGTNLPLCPSNVKPTIVVFEATPAEINKGGAVVIKWDVSNAETIELTQPVRETLLTKSGVKTFSLEQSTNFVLKATNFAGSIEKSASVTVKGSRPVIHSFSANPPTVIEGQPTKVVLSWMVAGVSAVSVEGVPGTFGATGSAEIGPLTAHKTYTLTATNEAGSVQQALTISIVPAGCATITATDLRGGPSNKYRVIESLSSDIGVKPTGRDNTGEWLRVQSQKEGWVPAGAVKCDVPILSFPVVGEVEIPPEPTDTPEPVAVPSVIVGMPVDRAVVELNTIGLVAGANVSEPHDTIPEGQVTRSEPAAGTTVARGSRVTLYVSSGPTMVEVPNVIIGMPVDRAATELGAVGLVAGATVNESHDTIPEGHVTRSDPAAGTKVARGARVTVYVSSGPATVEVPNVIIGMPVDRAVAELSAIGLVAGATVNEPHDTIPEGYVTRSDPAAGTKVARGSRITLVISSGHPPVTVPAVVGRTTDEAAALIRSAGLSVGSTAREYHPSIAKGRVIRSNPSAGASVKWGTPVALVVSLGTGQRRITVTFTKVTVHDDADDWTRGAGDIWFDFRVNGQAGRWPSSGTRDIDSGDTVTINLRLDVTVAQSETLSISVSGTDDDSPDSDDALGTVRQEYSSANNWGQGAHSVRSTCPDGCYTIYYTVSVVELP